MDITRVSRNKKSEQRVSFFQTVYHSGNDYAGAVGLTSQSSLGYFYLTEDSNGIGHHKHFIRCSKSVFDEEEDLLVSSSQTVVINTMRLSFQDELNVWYDEEEMDKNIADFQGGMDAWLEMRHQSPSTTVDTVP